MSFALKALGRNAMSPAAVEVVHDTAHEMTREHLVAVIRRVCLSHERLRAELDGSEALRSKYEASEDVQITSANSEDRIEEAISVLLHCWDDWDGEAQQEAQQVQSPSGWLDVMEEQVRTVLKGMVFDRD